MSNKSRLAFLVSIILACSSFSSCAIKKEDAELTTLRDLNAIEDDTVVKDTGLSASEKEAAVYAQVSNRTLLNLNDLEKVSDEDIQAIMSYMDNVNQQLTGSILPSDGVISQAYTDYLLTLFEKSPYYWQRSKMTVCGMDSASRSVIVDVTYKTIDFAKDIMPVSGLPKGAPQYDTLAKVRYSHWLDVLQFKYGALGWGIDDDSDKVPDYIDTQSPEYGVYLGKLNAFKEAYGEPSDIFASQINAEPTELVYATGNQRTFSGLVDSDLEKNGGEITIRYVLVPRYSMGINRGYTCKYMYLLKYEIDDTEYVSKERVDPELTGSIEETIEETLTSYFTALDEDNFSGLYRLSNNFGAIDGYYEDYFSTTYRKHGSITFTVVDLTGTRVDCLVTVSEKERPRGTEMSLPIYNSTYRVVMDLDTSSSILKVSDITLLSMVLKGEPALNADWVKTTGFNSNITLTSSDKKSIEDLVANFGVLQLAQNTKGTDFSGAVDTSISDNQMAKLKSSMLSVSGDKKVVWLTSYTQGTGNYASVRCRELVNKDGRIKELTTVYDFLNIGGEWKISGYTIESNVQLSTGDIVTKNALCVCTAKEVEEMTYTSTISDSDLSTSAGEIATNAVSTDFEDGLPTLKNGDLTVHALVVDEITDNDVEDYLGREDVLVELNDWTGKSFADGSEAMDYVLSLGSSSAIITAYKEIILTMRNSEGGFIPDDEANTVISDKRDLLRNLLYIPPKEDSKASDKTSSKGKDSESKAE